MGVDGYENLAPKGRLDALIRDSFRSWECLNHTLEMAREVAVTNGIACHIPYPRLLTGEELRLLEERRAKGA